MKKILTLLGAFVAVSANASVYFGADLGYAHYNINNSSFYQVDANENAADLRLSLGYEHKLEQSPLHLGVEFGLEGISSASDDQLSVRQGVSDLLITTRYELTPKTNLFAKAGPASVRESYAINNNESTTHSKTQLKVSVGGGYQLNDSVSLNATVSHITGSKLTNTSSSSSNTTSSTSVLVGLKAKLFD